VELVNVPHFEGMYDSSAGRVDHQWGKGGVLLPCFVCRNVEGFLDVGGLGVVVVLQVGHSGE
jgi:hypothetical protein